MKGKLYTRPYRFFLVHNETGQSKPFVGYTEAPLTGDLCEWVDGCFVQVWTAYEDTRYAAKMRLFNYLNFTRQGLPVHRCTPFAGTRIGVDIPVLNF